MSSWPTEKKLCVYFCQLSKDQLPAAPDWGKKTKNKNKTQVEICSSRGFATALCIAVCLKQSRKFAPMKNFVTCAQVKDEKMTVKCPSSVCSVQKCTCFHGDRKRRWFQTGSCFSGLAGRRAVEAATVQTITLTSSLLSPFATQWWFPWQQLSKSGWVLHLCDCGEEVEMEGTVRTGKMDAWNPQCANLGTDGRNIYNFF